MAEDKRKILVAEDESDLRVLLKRKLENSGYDVLEAVDGSECLKLSFEKHPDLIILDLIMPNKTGIEVLNELLNDDWGCKVPILVLTNKSDFGTEQRAFKYGAEEYMIKTETSLEDVVDRVKQRLT